MIEAFKNHINSKLPFLSNSKCLVACSGGLDSVVLTHLCHELKLDVTLAHCNFNLRGNESDTDEAFVLDLGEMLDLEVFIQNFDTDIYATTEKLSTQMAARELRYDWFSDLAESLKFDYILTAHHLDDNLETFLINLTRGTGLQGLTGIPEINDNIVRPLLQFSREDIEDYAKAHQLTWREDSSNASDKYLRNKLRHHVIPVLKETTPELLQNFKKTIDNLSDTADIVEESLRAVAKRAIIDIDGDKIIFSVLEFKKANNPKAYLYEMFKDYGFTAWSDIVDLLDAQPGKQVFSESYRLVKDREYLILTRRRSLSGVEVTESVNEAPIFINNTDKEIETPIGTLFFDEVDAIVKPSKKVIFIDKEALNYPLEFRLWKEGDSFQPLGMTGKKKLSKYLKDEKVSLVDKENTWLLTSNNTVVWVVGKRADDRFKVTPKTKEILRITIQ